MFYSRTFLAQKSPLGTVWIAAHLLRKLRKSEVVVYDISSSVDHIMFPEVPLALRLSGHLLLGVVRIYSKKVDYLFHDCNEFLTRIRTQVASFDITLPEDANHAPFHSVTLPETFELDALNLDDVFYHDGAHDKHLKTWDEITMIDQIPGEGDPYVAFFIDEGVRMDVFTQAEIPNKDTVPMEEDVTLPGNIDAGATESVPYNHMSESTEKLHEDQISQDLPETEVLRDAVEPLQGINLKDLTDIGDNIIEEPFNPTMGQKENLTPILEYASTPAGESLPSHLHCMAPNNVEEPEIFNSANSFEHVVPEMVLQPTPPAEKNKERARMRKQHYDEVLVLSNKFMKKQLQDTSRMVCKRKKLPLSALDVWRSQKRLCHELTLLEPSVSGLCSGLLEISKKTFSASETNPIISKQRSPCHLAGVPTFDMEIEQPRFGAPFDVAVPDFEQSPSGREVLSSNGRNLGSESQKGKSLEHEVLLTPDLSTFNESSHLDTETLGAPLDEEMPVGDTSLRQIPELVISASPPLYSPGKLAEGESNQSKISSVLNTPRSQDLNFLDAEIIPEGMEEKESDVLTERTRRMAQYLKEKSPSAEIVSGNLSMNKILDGETRKRCARMFYEALILKSCGYIEVHQDEAYGDITLSLTPLLKTKF